MAHTTSSKLVMSISLSTTTTKRPIWAPSGIETRQGRLPGMAGISLSDGNDDKQPVATRLMAVNTCYIPEYRFFQLIPDHGRPHDAAREGIFIRRFAGY